MKEGRVKKREWKEGAVCASVRCVRVVTPEG